MSCIKLLLHDWYHSQAPFLQVSYLSPQNVTTTLSTLLVGPGSYNSGLGIWPQIFCLEGT